VRSTPKRRIAAAGLFAILATVAAGCSKKTDGPMGPTPPTAGSTVAYVALGASDVPGIGSSAPCFPLIDCNGNGYVFVAARQLRNQGFTVTVNPLGLPGAVISRSFMDLAAQYGRDDVISNIIQTQLPFVPQNATLVTIFTGANDVNVITGALARGAGASNQTAFLDDQVAVFAADFASLVAGVRSRASGAKIVAINLPNLGAMPYLASESLLAKQAAQRASVRINATAINAAANVSVVDLMCDNRFYQRSSYSSDGFHPSDAGYAAIAEEVVKALTTTAYPAPRTTCSQMTLY
jgi:lysophospholipase L1-like esterase